MISIKYMTLIIKHIKEEVQFRFVTYTGTWHLNDDFLPF